MNSVGSARERALMLHHLLEDVLRREARLPHAESFNLRGGMLMSGRAEPTQRSAADLDFGRAFTADLTETVRRFRPILLDDGVADGAVGCFCQESREMAPPEDLAAVARQPAARARIPAARCQSPCSRCGLSCLNCLLSHLRSDTTSAIPSLETGHESRSH